MAWCSVAIVLGFLSACHPGAGAVGASQSDEDGGASVSTTQAAYDKSIAFLSLSQIRPKPSLPAAASKTDETSPRALRQIEEARSLFEEERYIEAMQRLERALRFSPNSLIAHQFMGRVSLEAGNTARAREHLAKALQIQEDDSETHYLQGRAYSIDGLWREALAEYRMLALCPDLDDHHEISVLSRYYLAEALAELGYLSAAIEEYEQFSSAALQPWPDSASAQRHAVVELLLMPSHTARSALYETLGRPLPAAQAMAEASALEPENPTLITSEARLFREARRYDSAAAAAKRLARFDVAAALPLLVSIRRNAEQPEQLVTDLKFLAGANPDDGHVVRTLADVYATQGKEDLAIQTLLGFMDAHAPTSEIVIALSQLYAQQQRWTESMNAIADVIDSTSNPSALLAPWLDDLRASGRAGTLLREVAGQVRDQDTAPGRLLVIGQIAHAAEDHVLAEEALKKCAQAAPGFTEAHVALAQVYLDGYRWHEAAASAQQAIDGAAEDHRGHRLLGQAYLGLDDFDRATTALNEAVRLNHADIASLSALLEVYELSGKPRQFERQNRILLERDPTNAQALQNLVLLALRNRDIEQVRRYVRAMEKVPHLLTLHQRFKALVTVSEDQDQDAYRATLEGIIEANPNDPDARMDLVGLYRADSRFDLAQQQLQEIVSSNPAYFSAQDLLCSLRGLELDYRWPIDNLVSRLAIHPHRIPWQQMLVQFLLDDQQYDRAADALTRFLKNPNLPAAVRGSFQLDLLMSYSLADRLPDAISSLQEWIEDQPQSGNLKELLFLLLHRNGETDRAVQLAEEWYQASSLSERNVYQGLLIRALWAAKRYADAEVIILDWLEIDPTALDPTRFLVETLRRAERFGDAIELAGASLLASRRTERLDYVGILLSAQNAAKAYDAALRLLRDELSLFSKPMLPNQGLSNQEFNLRSQLARVLIEARQFEAAESELNTLLKQTRDDRERAAIMETLSFCYQLTGRQLLYLKTLEEIHQIVPGSAGANNNLGYSWADAGIRLDEAEQMIRRAVGSRPRSAMYLDSLGWVLYKKGEFESAHEWLVRAHRAPARDWEVWFLIDEAPRGRDDAVLQDHLGDAAWRLDKKAPAKASWERAHELLLQTAEDERTAEQRLMLERIPAKIQAAAQGLEPDIATALPDN